MNFRICRFLFSRHFGFYRNSRGLIFVNYQTFHRAKNMSCAEINEKTAQNIMDSVDNFIFDCDGVLWDGLEKINGSPETLNKLKAKGKNIFFISNNSTSTRAQYVKKCAKFGIPAEEQEIMCTAYGAAQYLKNIKFDGKVYLVGNNAMAEELDKFDIRHTGLGPDPIPLGAVATDFKNIELDPEVNCVLVGFDAYLSYPKIVRAATYARREGCLFVATNEDTHLPLNCDTVIPGTGTMVAAVKVPARREPEVVGKPSELGFRILQETYNLDPSRTMMVGDRIDTDMAFGRKCGLQCFLVFTGVVTRTELENFKEGINVSPIIKDNLPDYVADKLGQLGQYLE